MLVAYGPLPQINTQYMVTIHTRPRQKDRQTDEHHGNSTTIRYNERIVR